MASQTTIMVVDDEPDLLAITKIMLEKKGYLIHGFTDPKEALLHVQEDGGCTDCKLVLSDVRMPSMSGIELVKHIKNLHPEVKVILMTAYKVSEEESQIVIPVDAFLNKPFRSAELIEAIEKAACK